MATGFQDDTEALEGELITAEQIDNSTALMALNKSEIDMQIVTAKRFPRSIKQFKSNAMELACLDEETAASMFYVLPRSGKKIEGPSARLAEVVGSSWGNLRYGSRIVSTDDKFITAQGSCFDLEKNIAVQVEVKRRITDKNGRRYNDDMIQVTGNAAMSVALRNAIFKIVPFALVKSVYENAKLTSIGKADSMQDRRQRAVDWFVKAGASQEQVLQAIERKGVDDITVDDLVTLTGLRTAIKDGESTIEEALGPKPDTKAKARKSDLNEKLDAGKNGNGKKSEDSNAQGQESSGEESQVAAGEYARLMAILDAAKEAKSSGQALSAKKEVVAAFEKKLITKEQSDILHGLIKDMLPG